MHTRIVGNREYQEDMGAVALCLGDLRKRLGRSERAGDAEQVRTLYRQDLRRLKDEEGYEVDIDGELAELPYDTADALDHMDAREEKIRRYYRRDHLVRPPAVRSEATTRKAVVRATIKKMLILI